MAHPYPFPQGNITYGTYTKDGTVELECTSFVAENIGDVPVSFLGRTLEPGESFSVPFGGVIYKEEVRIKFNSTQGNKSLYVLQTRSQKCQN